MKISFAPFKLVLMVFSLFAVIAIGANPALSAEEGRQRNNITVQGSSSVTVSPTIAYVNIGVTTFNKDATKAQSENAEKMDKVYKTLSSLGIAKDKIKTVTYNISQRYNYKNNVATLSGYDVTNGIQVTVMDLKKVSDVLDMSVKQGINQSNSISFGITDHERNKLYLQALAQAVVKAKEKATSIATAAGVTISKPSNIIEGSSSQYATSNYRMMDMAKAEMAPPTPISEGELKIEASVTAIYAF